MSKDLLVGKIESVGGQLVGGRLEAQLVGGRLEAQLLGGRLKAQLPHIAYNVIRNWDFVIRADTVPPFSVTLLSGFRKFLPNRIR